MRNFQCEEAEFDLDASNLMYGVRPSYGLGLHLREADPTQFSLFDILSQHPDRLLDGRLGIYTRALEYVQVLFAIENLQALVNSTSDTLLIALDGTFDRNDYLVGVLGILCEVGIEKLEGTPEMLLQWALGELDPPKTRTDARTPSEPGH